MTRQKKLFFMLVAVVMVSAVFGFLVVVAGVDARVTKGERGFSATANSIPIRWEFVGTEEIWK